MDIDLLWNSKVFGHVDLYMHTSRDTLGANKKKEKVK